MHLRIIISALLYLLHFLLLHKSSVYPHFVYILFEECSDDETMNIVLRNISTLRKGVHWMRLHHPREKSRAF